jgi:hypothetical protein
MCSQELWALDHRGGHIKHDNISTLRTDSESLHCLLQIARTTFNRNSSPLLHSAPQLPFSVCLSHQSSPTGFFLPNSPLGPFQYIAYNCREYLLRANSSGRVENFSWVRVRVRVTLQLTLSQSVCLGVEPNLELLTRDFLFVWKLQSCLIWGALSDERSGLSFASLQSVYSSQSVFTKNIYILCYTHLTFTIFFFVLDTFTIKRIKCNVQYIQASFSPGFAQQIMPWLQIV